MRRLGIATLLVLFGLGCTDSERPTDQGKIETPKIHTPRWAFEPWISKDISSTDDTYSFVAGFRERDIPIGVVVLDSPWETDYNTFIPNPVRYHDFDKLVGDLHADNIRLVLWVTQMINEDSFDIEQGGDTYDGPSAQFLIAQDRGYMVNGGETYFWWKGRGGGIDFFNPDAVQWWHEQQDHLLDLGLDGWKLDFGESYINTATIATAKGVVTHQEYSEEYYRDFWAYGVHRRGPEDFLTMSRPYDKSYNFEGRYYARPEHMPVGWVGDNRRDWVGLADALDHMFRSAQAGYVVLGSDIGGYLNANDEDLLEPIPYDDEAFMRWTALGALTPFMQLHGRANLEPWNAPGRTDQIVQTYYYWSWLHHELVPFFYSLAEEAYASGNVIMKPIGDGPIEWAGDYRFEVGDALLVAPQLDGTGLRDVEIPSGARYYDWWNESADALEGGTTLTDYTTESDQIPLFVKEGAIIPAQVEREATGLGTAASAEHLTVLIYPSETLSTFYVHEEDGLVTTVRAEREGGRVRIELDRSRTGVILRARTDEMPRSVRLNQRALPGRGTRESFDIENGGWFPEPDRRVTWIKLPPQAGLHELELLP